jgi:hypothetical protein
MASTAAATALAALAAQQQVLSAQPNMTEAVARPERRAAVAVAAVQQVGREPVTAVALHLAVVAMQALAALAVLQTQTVARVLSTGLGTVLAAAVAEDQQLAPQQLAARMALAQAVDEATHTLAVMARRALSSLSTARPFRLASVSRAAKQPAVLAQSLPGQTLMFQ